MANKPWLNKSFLDIRKSTARDYTGDAKRKKPWKASSFVGMEHFHEGNYDPIAPVLPPKVGDPCAGRVLYPLGTQRTIECGEEDINITPSGGVGGIQYELTDLSVVNAEVDSKGNVTLSGCATDGDSFITFWVCDDCGCSTYTLWFEDCSSTFTSGLYSEIASGSGCTTNYVMKGDADSAFPISNLESRSYCSGDAPPEYEALAGTLGNETDEISIGYTYQNTDYRGYDACGDLVALIGPVKDCSTCGGGDTVSGPSSIASCGDGASYTFNNTDGSTEVWSVSGGDLGSGGGIDSGGNLTTGAGCCGTVTVTATNSCCTASKAVTMPNGFWDQISVTDNTTPLTHPSCSKPDCSFMGGGTPKECEIIADGIKTIYKGECIASSICTTPCTGAPCSPAGGCSGSDIFVIRFIEVYVWACP